MSVYAKSLRVRVAMLEQQGRLYNDAARHYNRCWLCQSTYEDAVICPEIRRIWFLAQGLAL